MITYRRTRLQSDIIEACQCLKSWYQPDEELFDDEEAIETALKAMSDSNMDE